MAGSEDKRSSDVWFGLAGFGAVALVIGCCGAFPIAIGLSGMIAAGAILGIGAAAVALIAVIAVVVACARRRAACKKTEPQVAVVNRRWRPRFRLCAADRPRPRPLGEQAGARREGRAAEFSQPDRVDRAHHGVPFWSTAPRGCPGPDSLESPRHSRCCLRVEGGAPGAP